MNRREVYEQGQAAKQEGKLRVSPYSKLELNALWYGGYDGVNIHILKRDSLEREKRDFARIGLNNV